MICSAAVAAFYCTSRNGRNQKRTNLGLLPASLHCLMLLAGCKLFASWETVPLTPSGCSAWTSFFIVLPHHWVVWCPHGSLLSFVVSCLFSYTTYEHIERHSSLQEHNLHCESWFSFLPFLLPPLKILFYKGSHLFLNTSLSLSGVFEKGLVQSFL